MTWKSSWRAKNRQSYQSSSYRPSRRSKSNLIYRLGLLSFIGVLGLFLVFGIIFPIFALNLPSPDKLVRREGYSTKIYDRNQVLLYDIFTNERRTPVKFEDIPSFLKNATIATEDKNFYQHEGFDALGVLRGFSRLFTSGRAQGGSTITQQLVKNVLLSSERSLPRKIREFILAVQIERKYSKDEILQMYLNEAPYGGTAWGVGAAADIYFGKAPKDLTLIEAAVLAGLPQRPSSYSPYGASPKGYIDRTKSVLRRMREDGYITEEQEGETVKQLESVKFVGKGASLKAPHFVMYVKDQLEQRYGASLVEQGGLKVTTTLDWDLQEKAQNAISEEIAKVENLHITNGAAVVMDPNNGHILAMVGSKNFEADDYDGQVNVTLSLRQPGSAIKPVTYVSGLRKGYTAATLLMDVPTTFPGGVNLPDYEPINYDGKYRGPMQVRFALANSLNIPAVKMLAMVGVENMLETASQMGLKTLEPTRENLSRFGLSVTLGGGEVRLLDLTSSYSAFANKGLRFDPISILKVEDAKGKVLEEYKEKDGKKVLEPAEAFIISDILSDPQARAEIFGTRSALSIGGRRVAAKTGTTNDQRDNWTIGWTPQIIAGVWVGNNDNSPMKQVASGTTGAAPIWRRIIIAALAGRPNTDFETPDDIVTAEVDSLSGFRSHDGYPSRNEYFIKGTEPDGNDPVHTRLRVCGSGEEKEYYVFKEEDPTAAPGGENRWQKAIIDWISTQADEKYHPPAESCGSNNSTNPVNVEFVKPRDHDRIDSETVELKIEAKSNSEIVQVEIELDGIKQATLTSSPWSMTLSGVKKGVHELRAKAKDKNGTESDRKIKIGVNTNWDS